MTCDIIITSSVLASRSLLGTYNKTDLVSASSPALVIVQRDESEDERDEEDDVRREDVHVPEGQPPLEDPFTTWWRHRKEL